MRDEVRALVRGIREDRRHGAAELAERALLALRLVAESSPAAGAEALLAELKEAGRALAGARPTMVAIAAAVRRFLQAVAVRAGEVPPAELRRLAVACAEETTRRLHTAAEKIAVHAGGLLPPGAVVMAHSYSSTVLAALRYLHGRGKVGRVVVTRAGAGRTGLALAGELAGAGVPVWLIDDTAVALFLPGVVAVFLGADAVYPDGVVNGVGSLQVAVLAARQGVPVYVLADTFKLAPRPAGEMALEEGDPVEVAGGVPLPAGVVVSNPRFDVTPPGLITALVTEEGALPVEAALERLTPGGG